MGNRIKDEDQYEALRDDGASKEKAARIANSSNSGKKGGNASKIRRPNQRRALR